MHIYICVCGVCVCLCVCVCVFVPASVSLCRDVWSYSVCAMLYYIYKRDLLYLITPTANLMGWWWKQGTQMEIPGFVLGLWLKGK